MNQPIHMFLQALMIAGSDIVMVVNKIFYSTSRRNNLNYTSKFDRKKRSINISGKILGQSMKIFEDAAVARN